MTSPHQYGPHRPEHAPNAVTVLTGGRFWPSSQTREEVLPLPESAVRQREQLNTLAHRRANGEGVLHDCEFCGREVWTPTPFCVLCRSVIVVES